MTAAVSEPWTPLPVPGDIERVVPPGEPPELGRMGNRMTALETRIDTILPTLATRSDMHSLDASIKTWMIATVIGLFLGFAGLFFAMNNLARPTTPGPASQAPIVIQLPAYASVRAEESPPAKDRPDRPRPHDSEP